MRSLSSFGHYYSCKKVLFLFSKIELKQDANILMIRHAQSQFNQACTQRAIDLGINHLSWF